MDAPLDPRAARSRATALDAAARLLVSEGRDALTQPGVAAASGISRATVYRLWPDRTALVHDALEHVVELAHARPSGGDVVARVEAELWSLGRQLDGPLRAALVTLIEQAQRDAVAAGVLDRLRGEGTRVLRAELRSAAQAGQLRAGVTVDGAVALLVGSLLYRGLVERRPISHASVRAAVRAVLAGVAT